VGVRVDIIGHQTLDLAHTCVFAVNPFRSPIKENER
jgi:hypothetical protein